MFRSQWTDGKSYDSDRRESNLGRDTFGSAAVKAGHYCKPVDGQDASKVITNQARQRWQISVGPGMGLWDGFWTHPN